METREYRTINKKAWGERQWPDEATGLPCLITRHHFMGHLCGYVGVPPGHPAHGRNHTDLDVSAHGGCNFSSPCEHNGDESSQVCHVPGDGEPDDVWWFGFDCAHAFDAWPALSATLKIDLPVHFALPGRLASNYRDLAYVTDECASLARQLAAMATPVLSAA